MTFEDVPWRWGDVVIGLVPLLAATSGAALINPLRFASAPRWLWVPATMIAMAWMFAFPLGIARSRAGLPMVPRPRVVLREALLALLAVPVIIMIVSVVTAALAVFLGEPDSPIGPLEPLAGSANRFESLTLIVLAIAVAPVAEEVFFRGMVFNALRHRLHPAPAAVLQAVAFGLLHPFGFRDRAVIAVLGLCVALFYQWRKTLAAPVLLHALINAASLSLMFWAMASAADAPALGVRVTAHQGGCLVTEVIPGGAAEESGLRVGDVVESVGGESVTDFGVLIRAIKTRRVAEVVPVDYVRGGRAYRVEVTLKGRPR